MCFKKQNFRITFEWEIIIFQRRNNEKIDNNNIECLYGESTCGGENYGLSNWPE